MTEQFAEITRRLHDGDAARGAATFERILRLAGVTDDQQRFMFQRIDVLPQDARDIIAYLATQGILVTAVAP
jgi:phosphoserine phosphatase